MLLLYGVGPVDIPPPGPVDSPPFGPVESPPPGPVDRPPPGPVDIPPPGPVDNPPGPVDIPPSGPVDAPPLGPVDMPPPGPDDSPPPGPVLWFLGQVFRVIAAPPVSNRILHLSAAIQGDRRLGKWPTQVAVSSPAGHPTRWAASRVDSSELSGGFAMTTLALQVLAFVAERLDWGQGQKDRERRVDFVGDRCVEPGFRLGRDV
jgi:hypothetical protein